MKKFLILLIVNSQLSIVNSCYAQNRKIDSLQTLLKTDKADTNKVKHLNALGWLLMNQNPDTSIILGNQALDIITPAFSPEFTSAKEGIEGNNIRLLRAGILYNLGVYYRLKADFPRSLDNFLKSLKIHEELKNKKNISSCLGNIAIVYGSQADYPKALDYALKALKMAEELQDKNGIAKHLCNIGIIHRYQANYSKALDYYFKALKIAEELGDKNGIAIKLDNIGIVYGDQKDYSKALIYFFKALKISEELGDKNEIANVLGNIGNIYSYQCEDLKALDYYFKALKITEELGNKNGVATKLGNIGTLYTAIGKFKEAEQYLKRAIALDDSIGALEYSREFEESLSQLYDTTGRYKLALIHYKKAIALKDTIFSQENKKQLIRKEMNYEFDKKETAAKAQSEKQQAVADEKNRKQQVVILFVVCGLLFVVVFAGFIFRSLRITRKQKNIIELQKNEVTEQKDIADSQRIIAVELRAIAEKQKEKIVDSITYAQRIQQSILIEESEIKNYLPESFIYFQPKDIVSGDFYWFSKINNKIIIAAVDCTGHGVPGAFMSMIGNTLLNQIVNEKQITKPSEILRLLNLGVYEALHQQKDGALSDDGMDIAFCTIDYAGNEIQYAGQNPLYILSDGQIEVIKGDIYGIGGGGMIAKLHDPLKKTFVNHVIPIKKDMSIYLFSDGYMDQFGGPVRKKFGAQKFKDLLLNNQHLNMQQQKERIASAHIEWKANTSQIDDILVIGVRI